MRDSQSMHSESDGQCFSCIMFSPFAPLDYSSVSEKALRGDDKAFSDLRTFLFMYIDVFLS